ncbi:methylglyoxal synthase [Rhodothermaceae bacterium RA]|nr:methylglyoxal synthase [Rhodothermaceae bacterium RA]
MPDANQTIALIAHDGKKADMVAFAMQHRDLLSSYRLIATNTTGSLLRDKVGLEIQPFLSGPLGGDVQIAAQVVVGDVQAVFFFVDPLAKHPHDPDIQTLLRACNVHNVPLATNAATAHLILRSRLGPAEASRK